MGLKNLDMEKQGITRLGGVGKSIRNKDKKNEDNTEGKVKVRVG